MISHPAKRSGLPLLISVFILLAILFSQKLYSQDTVRVKKIHRPKVGLVLSGGGAKGFAYIGLLKTIQDAGLNIDYIGGSSIGSIMGGLYAVGYHPDTIAKIIRSQNWMNLLQDNIDRKYIAYEEKEFGEQTIIRLPIRNKKLRIGSAMYSGQEISLLLNHYFSPVYKTTDFSKFKTPFLCIGTDILAGKEVVLDHGYVPRAARASMAIPGFFTPVNYQGHLLVDGGVVNNYPAREVRRMGAEIIIGGDLQSDPMKDPDQINSIGTILEQITSFPRTEANRIGDSLTDIKVKLQMQYGILDFTKYDSIIAFGERISRSYYPQLKALADSLNAIEYVPVKRYDTRPLDSFEIDTTIIRGENSMPKKYFASLFPKMGHTRIAVAELEKSIRLMNGSGFFEDVTYEFEQQGNKTNLIINARQGGPGALSAGLHFDSDYNVDLILNGEFHNLLGRNSKLLANLNIGIYPRLRVTYLKGVGGQASFGLSTDFYYFRFDSYDKDLKTNQISFTNYKSSLYFQYAFRNMIVLKAGVDYEYFKFSQEIHVDSTLDSFDHFTGYGTLFFSLNADTRDRPYFAHRGVLATFRGEYVAPLSKNWSRELFSNAGIFYLKYDHFIPLSRRFVVAPGVFGGMTLWDDNLPALQHIFAFGGNCYHNYIDQYVPFTGLRFFQRFGVFSLAGRMKAQYNIFEKLYLTLQADAGANEMSVDDLFASRNFLVGYGLTASYDSFIGPVGISVMGSNLNPGALFFLNIGYGF
jgi:NTE family protein